MIFASTVPMIAFAGVLFFGLRHVCDAYNLLTVNRKEIDSSCKMFQKILLNFQFAILLLQLSMIAYFSLLSHLPAACFLGVTFLISTLVVILTNKSLFDREK